MHQRAKLTQKKGGDGKPGGVSIHEEMHKFKWVSVKRVVGVGVYLFLKECCFRIGVRVDKKLSITKTVRRPDTSIGEVGK